MDRGGKWGRAFFVRSQMLHAGAVMGWGPQETPGSDEELEPFTKARLAQRPDLPSSSPPTWGRNELCWAVRQAGEWPELPELRGTDLGDVSPVLAGFLGAGVLVVSVTVAVFLWTCCQRRYRQLTGSYKLGGDAARDPPYRFIHMLKGISIYPETLSNSRKIVRVARRLGPRGPRDREWCRSGGNAGGGVLLVKPGTEPGAGRELPVQPNGCSQEGNDASSSSCEASETASPSSPAQERSLGTLSLAVDYNFPKKALVSNSSDPYIKMTILPEKKHRVKTRVMRKTLDPAFDETFTFYGVPYSTLPELVLHFLALSFDRFSRDDVIGEAVVPLAGVDPSTGRVQLTQEICKRTIQTTRTHTHKPLAKAGCTFSKVRPQLLGLGSYCCHGDSQQQLRNLLREKLREEEGN
ncbi:hypothetical protein Z043_123222 [Scleropages formosus]|uniref:C2 domain-containing protein n=1 Tax=Scleropages formosus TaxID=113540 RepID=A0A0P7UDV2_SCLFO|nr:hypothetical protein Z043_123222 [Scleropages formosus]